MQADRLIGARRAHPARTADVSGPGDPDAREGDITLLRESIHKKLQNRVNGALARETKCEFLQDLEVHGVIRDLSWEQFSSERSWLVSDPTPVLPWIVDRDGPRRVVAAPFDKGLHSLHITTASVVALDRW